MPIIRIGRKIKFLCLVMLSGAFIFGMTLILSYAQPKVQNPQMAEALIEARLLSTDLTEKVRGLLLQEIEKGGFLNAVRVCSQRAQEITQQFNRRPGHYARRVSLKTRNPKNIPDDDERRKLEEFDFLNREKRLGNEYVEVVKEDGRTYLRYMRPLVTIPLCINCHGSTENIPSEVKSILSEKYPEDQATGFLVGDLRGAISVKINLQPD